MTACSVRLFQRVPATSQSGRSIHGRSKLCNLAFSIKSSTVLLAAIVISGMSLGDASEAHAQRLTILHTFTGAPDDGADAEAGLLDDNGTLYGTTALGGNGKCKSQGVSGCGTVYTLGDGGGKYKVLYNFKGGKDGSWPGLGGLISDGEGNFYGTTLAGGTGKCKDGAGVTGCGTVFRVTSAGVETVIYSFQGPTKKDGWAPMGAIVRDSEGNIYGTTSYGGSQDCSDGSSYIGCGTVFKVTSGGVESVLYNFKGGKDGEVPFGGLVMDSAENLYGTTTDGMDTTQEGTVFKVTRSGAKTALYKFSKSDPSDGWVPFGGLAMGASDDLYGTTITGGPTDRGLCCGVLFNVLTRGGTSTILHDFTNGTTDGREPYAALALDSAGNLYGTTITGGKDDGGVVFKLGAGGSPYEILANLNGTSDGTEPLGTLAIDSKGNVYGTTTYGGDGNCVGTSGTQGCGTVFKVAP
jgi:uncharacterized repeat protein (TIGR03803 family)